MLKRDLGIEATLEKGAGGIYTVSVDGVIVAQKTLMDGFPTSEQVVAAVRKQLGGP